MSESMIVTVIDVKGNKLLLVGVYASVSVLADIR
jgi:hypothetical protein